MSHLPSPSLWPLALLLLTACPSSPPPADGGDDDDTTPDVPAVETACEDGIDEDQDGATDCEDSDCAAVVAVQGACVSPEDLAIYRDLDGNAEWNACVPGPPAGEGCLNDVDCNTTCIATNTGLTTECSGCFAELISCFISNCGTACAGNGQGSPECTACVADRCGDAYQACFGDLVCPYEYGCRDTTDNDGDDLIDGDDPDCQ